MNPRPKIAILHGWATDPKIMQPVVQPLEEAGYTVLPYEMPGYGSRSSESDATKIDDLVDDALENLAGADIWIGWSLGAMVALAAAATNPKFLKGIVAVCPTAKFCCDAEKEVALSNLRRSVEQNAVKAVKRFHRSMPASKNRRSFVKNSEIVANQNVSVSLETLLSGLEILARADLSEEVNKIDVPVALIGGTEDSVIPASSGQALQCMIPNCRYTPLPCGHLPFLECPELFMEHVFEFAQTIAESTASQKPV